MKSGQVVEMKIVDIGEAFNPREARDESREWHFAELMQDGVKFKPPVVWGSRKLIIDGRTRVGAKRILEEEVVEVRLMEFASEAEAIAYAYRANLSDGPKLPTEADTRHTISLLLRQKCGKDKIVASLAVHGLMPDKLIRKFVDEVAKDQVIRKLNAAVNAVVEGTYRLDESAVHYEVDAEKVKELLKKRKKEAKREGAFTRLRNLLSIESTSYGKHLGAMRRQIDEQYEKQELTASEAKELIAHMRDRQNRVMRTLRRGIEELLEKYPELGTVADAVEPVNPESAEEAPTAKPKVNGTKRNGIHAPRGSAGDDLLKRMGMKA